MPAKCSEDWNGRGLTQDVSGQWTATRVWCSIDALNEQEALSAAPEPGNDPIPSLGVSHPQNALLRVRTRTPVTDGGPQTWKTTVQYAIPTIGPTGGGDPDPLARPKRARWGRGTISLPVDRDARNHALVNSAGDAFEGQSRTFEVRTLSIVRWEPFYSAALDDIYSGTINSNTVVLGAMVALPGEMFCMGIYPTQEYEYTATAVEMSYNFEIIRDIRTGAGGSGVRIRPYTNYLKDQGKRGWYNEGGSVKLGELYYTNEQGQPTQVNEYVPLNGAGRPLEASIKVTDKLFAPVDAPTNVGPGIIYDPSVSSPFAKYFGFEMIRAADHAAIGVF